MFRSSRSWSCLQDPEPWRKPDVEGLGQWGASGSSSPAACWTDTGTRGSLCLCRFGCRALAEGWLTEKALQSEPPAFSRGKRKLIENKSSLEIAGVCLWENGGINFATARGTDGHGEGGTAKPEQGDPGQTVPQGMRDRGQPLPHALAATWPRLAQQSLAKPPPEPPSAPLQPPASTQGPG